MNNQETNLISGDTIDVLLILLRVNPQIEWIELFTPARSPQLHERIHHLDKEETLVLQKADEIRNNFHLPFWDAVMASCVINSTTSSKFIKAVLFHNPSSSGLMKIHRDQFEESKLRAAAQNHSDRSMTAISSCVGLNGNDTRKHIPMLDFHCKASIGSLLLVRSIISSLGIPGYILSSGKSYHFYGLKLLNNNELRNFLARALLFGPVVDRAWIAHQLIEEKCALRISPRPEYGGIPHIVAFVDHEECYPKNP